ncbi:MAG: sugar phosphate isomerase/epimerase family protein [Gemmataceae bacterium]
MTPAIRIGNQTAISCRDRMRPFEFALEHGFTAFEWFADKRSNGDGSVSGWDEADMDAGTRAWIRDTGKAHDVRFTVHAPWQANPLAPEAAALLRRSVDFARDIGAELVNLHLYMEQGATAYVRALAETIRYAAAAGVRLSIENTPHTSPDDFNRTFARLRQWDAAAAAHVGMCLDLGHANLCAATRNDYLRYLDALAPEVPLIHLHVHENYGDADTHLTLFTGPSRSNDAGVRGFLDRLRQRGYRGALILEQWPDPPDLLVAAASRLRGLLGAESANGVAATAPLARAEDDGAFLRALATAATEHTSWRGRLQWVRDRFADPTFRPTVGELATVAIFLR